MSGKRYVDIMPRGVSKGSALRRLMEHLQIEANEVACIGDSFNDISMFEVTPHSFTLHHAHPYVKERANHIVRSVEEAIMKLPLLSIKKLVTDELLFYLNKDLTKSMILEKKSFTLSRKLCPSSDPKRQKRVLLLYLTDCQLDSNRC